MKTTIERMHTTIKQSKFNKHERYLAFRYGTWTCNLCAAVNLMTSLNIRTGDTYGEILNVCSVCGQTNYPEDEQYND